MSSIKDMLIVLLICGALCTVFFFIGKSYSKKVIKHDTDTLVITKKDTTYIKVKIPAVIKDTIVIIDSVAIPYEYASIETTLVNIDSSYVHLNIGYDTYYKQFDLQGQFVVISKAEIIKEYIESPKKRYWFYGALNALVTNGKPNANVDFGVNFENDYYMGMILGYDTIGLSIGRRW